MWKDSQTHSSRGRTNQNHNEISPQNCQDSYFIKQKKGTNEGGTQGGRKEGKTGARKEMLVKIWEKKEKPYMVNIKLQDSPCETGSSISRCILIPKNREQDFKDISVRSSSSIHFTCFLLSIINWYVLGMTKGLISTLPLLLISLKWKGNHKFSKDSHKS